MFLSVMLVLSGCTSPGGDPSPGVTSPAGTAGETTPPTTTTAVPPPPTAAVYKPASDTGPAENVPNPVLPAKAQEFSKEGLIAFAEYWYSTLGYAFETGDPEPMMTISAPDCKTCGFISEPVSGWYKDGGWIVGGQMTILQSTSPFAETTDGAYQAMLLVRQSKVSYYAADGTLSVSHPQAIARTNLVEATYDQDRWTAKTAEILKKG
ncbi:hypothetical protein MB46_05295 [Arthrobacter alpinus]|nr:hypothetical protein MB46_05295 [Arthrobacter alpinus]